MRVEKEKGYPGFQVGTSFLLVIFVIICLVILGVLSLSGALRDKSYSDKVTEKTGLYYAAVSEAQHKLGEIDQFLDGISKAGGYEAYLDDVNSAALALDGVVCTRDMQRLALSYEIPITDSQVLFVEVLVSDPEKGEGNYKITKWQEKSISVWEEETTLPVLQFGEE